MITATLLKNTAPQSAWLVRVKNDEGDEKVAACTTLGAAKRTAVLFASSFLDAPRKKLPWHQEERTDGVQYFRADIDD